MHCLEHVAQHHRPALGRAEPTRLEPVLRELVRREVEIEPRVAADEPGFEPSPAELRARSAAVRAGGGEGMAEYLIGRYGDQVDQLVRQLWQHLRLLEAGSAARPPPRPLGIAWAGARAAGPVIPGRARRLARGGRRPGRPRP
ncbi:MAG TPA: hypothetical protein VFY87_11970, partial [Geminicoccaceae bacterium]|nr:hypothetical protein [Geminicoccaceae bacterium]